MPSAVPDGFFETAPTRKSSRLLIAVALSVLAHLLFVLGVFKFVQPVVKPPHLSVVELIDAPKAILTDETSAARQKGVSREAILPVLKPSKKRPAIQNSTNHFKASTSQFTPSFRPSFHSSEIEVQTGERDPLAESDLASSNERNSSMTNSNATKPPGDDPNSEWGSGSRDFARVADIGRYTKFYDLIDSHVFYPNVFTKNGIEGVVNARLVLTTEGRCDWRKTRVRSKQGHLQVLVLSILHETCAANLKSFAKSEGFTNLDLSFGFAITEHDDKGLKDSEKKVVGNVFLFYRNNQQSALEWQLGPFRGLFPVPFVALDFAWFEENYDRVINSRDPLKEFSDHLKIQDETAHEG